MSLPRLLFLLALAAIGVIASQPAHAQVTAYAVGQGAVNSIEVGVEVRASVLGRCGFAAGVATTGTGAQDDFEQKARKRDGGGKREAVSDSTGGSRNITK